MEQLEIKDEQDVRPDYRRVKDVQAARTIHGSLEQADQTSSRDRARIQRMIDGGPPHRPDDLARAGMKNCTNINFGQGEALLNKALVPYINLLTNVETKAWIPVRSGNKQRDYKWSKIVSQEFSKLLTDQEDWFYNELLNCHYFLSEGVSICWFPDYHDFRYEVASLCDFKLPRKTRMAGKGAQVVTCVRDMNPSDLYQFIQDESASSDVGWNPAQVKRAIVGARADDQNSQGKTWRAQWEKLAEEAKNNDLWLDAVVPTIECVNMWVEELDGQVSHYIFPTRPLGSDNEQDPEDFLYVRENAYTSMEQAFVGFTYGIGTNGKIHSVRGLGWKIFPKVQLMNRMWSRRADIAMLSASLAVQPIDENAGVKAEIMYRGPLAVLPPGATIIDRPMQNLGEAVGPMLSDLGAMTREQTGHYMTDNAFQGGKERTRFEVAAQLEQDAEMSATAQQLFYVPQDKKIQEQFRRVATMQPGHRGWEEVERFFQRCEDRGVDPEWIRAVDHKSVRVIRAVGNGSQAMRRLNLNELKDNAASFDPIGRQNVMVDWAAALVGYDQAERYVPMDEDEQERIPIDAQIAELQNYRLMEGQEVSILPGENLIVHARVHVSKLMETRQRVDQGEMDIAEAALQSQLLVQHATDTLEMVGQDPTVQVEAGQLRQALQQMGEIMVNGLRRARRNMERQAAQQAVPGGPEQPEQQSQVLENQLAAERLQADIERLRAQRDKIVVETDLAVAKQRAASANMEAQNKIKMAAMLQ